MTNKMMARVLFYTQGLPSYCDSKGTKNLTRKIVLPSFKLVYGDLVFWMQRRMVPYSTGINCEFLVSFIFGLLWAIQ